MTSACGRFSSAVLCGLVGRCCDKFVDIAVQHESKQRCNQSGAWRTLHTLSGRLFPVLVGHVCGTVDVLVMQRLGHRTFNRLVANSIPSRRNQVT